MTTFTAILIGDVDHPHRRGLASALQERTSALAHSRDSLDIRDQANLPVPLPRQDIAAIVFCRKQMQTAEIAAINACVGRGMPIIPVVEDLTKFTETSPAEVGRFKPRQSGEISRRLCAAGRPLYRRTRRA
jgi:hypothetical protein